MLVLHHDWASFCSIKVRLCLAEKQLDWESRFVNVVKLEHLEAEYLKLNPNAVVPTLVHDGRVVWESSFINEYLDEVFPEVPLIPKDPWARARMRYWVKYEDDVLHPIIRPATYNLIIRQVVSKLPTDLRDRRLANHPNPFRAGNFRDAINRPVDVQAVEDTKSRIAHAIDRMDKWLAQNRWLAGDDYSLADVAAAPFVDRVEELQFKGMWGDKRALRDWITRIKARPAYRKAIPLPEQRMAALSWD